MLRHNLNLLHKMFHTQKGTNVLQLLNNARLVISTKYSTHFYNMKCWHCGKTTSSDDGIQFACSHCGTLLALPDENIVSNFLLYSIFSLTSFSSTFAQDYFQILGFERKYNIDTVELRNQFRKFQSSLHPDKFGTK